MVKIAFLGLGVMGKPMALNLLNAGLSVNLWNRTKDKLSLQSLSLCQSIAEAVKDAQIIFTCLGDVPDVEQVLLSSQGVINFASPNTLVVDFSTIGTQAVQNIAQQLATKQIRFLDAPMSGGDIGAQQGTLTIMVGGKQEDYQECLPYLQILGKNITYCGEIGSGQAVKLCNQVLASLHMVAICEAITLAKQQGIDPKLMIEVCSTGAAGSWALTNLAPKIINEDYSPGFMIKHILKDLRLVKESLSGNHLQGVELATQLFQQTAELNDKQGFHEGTQAMIKTYI